MFRPRRPIALLAVLLAGGGLSACGKHQDEEARVQQIENEGLYLSLGDLKYQVQNSRQLNPNDVQDRQYLQDVPVAQRTLKADEVWFGVSMQVENESDRFLRPSGDIEIADTQDEIFKPLVLNPESNFAYRAAVPIPPGHIMPVKDTAAFDTPAQGALLIFKLKRTALDNRPLELKIEGNQLPKQTGIIDLDV